MEMPNDIPLQNAILTCNPQNRTAEVIKKKDLGCDTRYCYVGGGRSDVFKMNDTAKMLQLYMDAWHAIHVHGIPQQEVDYALRVIPEYRSTLASDFPPRPYRGPGQSQT